MKEMIDISNQKFSFIGSGTIIKGDLVIKETSHIAGKIEGNLFVETKTLLLERSSEIFGKIHCLDLEVYGKVEGEIEAKGKVTIYPTAKILGKLQAQDLVIYPGAQVSMEGKTLSTQRKS